MDWRATPEEDAALAAITGDITLTPPGGPDTPGTITVSEEHHERHPYTVEREPAETFAERFRAARVEALAEDEREKAALASSIGMTETKPKRRQRTAGSGEAKPHE